jgi:hypothetical protein
MDIQDFVVKTMTETLLKKNRYSKAKAGSAKITRNGCKKRSEKEEEVFKDETARCKLQIMISSSKTRNCNRNQVEI